MRLSFVPRFLIAGFALSLAVFIPLEPAGAAPAGRPAAKPPAKTSRLERVAQALEAERARLQIPGLSFAVIEDDRVLIARGLGVRDLTTKLAVDSMTVFPIGSCSKAFTALVTEIAQDEGKLSLDDSPRRFFPWFRMADPEANELVTLRDLLCHRTGLAAYGDLAAEPNVLTRLEYVRAACGAKPTARFREKFQYSNAAVVAAGEAVALAEHTTWEKMIAEKILEPLGMRSSAATTAELTRFANHATGYSTLNDSGVRHVAPPPPTLSALAPAGSIISSASDMARWARLMLAEGTIDGRRIVSATGVRDVMTPHTTARPGFWYGLCWGLYDWNDHRVVEHNGGSDGISALVSLMPDRKLGFVILANTTPTSLTKVGTAARILYPILTGEAEKAPPIAPPSRASQRGAEAAEEKPDTTDLPSAHDLLVRMVAAAGGEKNLRAHKLLEVQSRKSYANHGVDADVTLRWAMPNRRDEEERWSAAGRSIGTVRFFCDGERAGQETSFGQDQMFSGEELERALRNSALDWFLDPARFGIDVRVVGRQKRGEESVYLLETKSKQGATSRFAVSTRTNLIVERVTGTATETYSDFKSVDGRVWPYRTVIHDELGESDVEVRSVRYDVAPPGGAFGPRKPTTGPATAGR
jgi:CubicO group peptidase (beta-lactamase class C family)